MTFDQMKAIDKRLAILEHDVELVSRSRHPFNFWRAWSGFKHRMSTIVGFDAVDSKAEILLGCDAYDTAYQHLFAILNRSKVAYE